MNGKFDGEKPSPAEEDGPGKQTNWRLEAPPPNHPAKTMFRVFLWLLPTAFTLLTLSVFVFTNYTGFSSQINSGICIVLTLAFTIGAGWYNALLSNRAKIEPSGVSGRIVLFVFIQLFLVPLLLTTLLFAACLISPVRFPGM